MSNPERDLLDVDDGVSRLTDQKPTRGYSGYYYVINDNERDLLCAAWPRVRDRLTMQESQIAEASKALTEYSRDVSGLQARISELEADNSTLYHAVAQEAQRALKLEAENAALRALLTHAARDAQFQEKHIHPVGGPTYQNWLLDVYLPVPLTETDKSVERALEAYLEKSRRTP